MPPCPFKVHFSVDGLGKAKQRVASDQLPSTNDVDRSGTSGLFVRAPHANRPKGSQSLEEACEGCVENIGEAKLCLPTLRGTAMSSLLVSLLTFMGLVALGVSEVRGFGSRSGWLTLLLRWLGWLCLYYLPIFFVAVPFIRNFVLWSLNPGEGLTKAFDYRDVGSDLRWKRAAWLPYVQHTAWVAASWQCYVAKFDFAGCPL